MKNKNPKEYIYRPNFKVQAKNIEAAKSLISSRLQAIVWHPDGIDLKDIEEVKP
ncbi:MAG: hypothetical protein MUP81_00180 [Dehalococcoidia bacterium]|nr:hypothetical protein [Dehalococcoidia bacterium]